MTDEAQVPYKGQKDWKCPWCGLERGADGHDPCLGELPGVKYACCGHAGYGACEPYILFENGLRISFVPVAIDYHYETRPYGHMEFPSLRGQRKNARNRR
jgi:hypothetical protein